MSWPNPLIPGFNPDPSIVLVRGAYYAVTSTFEYLPGLPVYRSTDLVDWTHIGNVATRPEQLQLADVPTMFGAWAPTIRHRDGVFHVIVTVTRSPKGCVVFTAGDPAGPWSDGITIDGIDGIDPDLAWDEEGAAYVTYSGLRLSSDDSDQHVGILQAKVDLEAGQVLEEPRFLWSGTGLKFPEAPHLYRRGKHWYLLIAEGGTERGHAVSVARGPSPAGPFVGHPANPVLSARSTSRSVQSTGHGDLVETPDGGWAMVLLGLRPVGLSSAFSPLGRETFITDVSWVDGWPLPEPVEAAPRAGVLEEVFDMSDPATLDDPGWLAVRRLPADVATVAAGALEITADGGMLGDRRPCFVGRRQRHLYAVVSTRVDASCGVGGLAARYDEAHWFGLEVALQGELMSVTARARVAGLAQEWTVTLPGREVELRVELTPPASSPNPLDAWGGDRIRLIAAAEGQEEVLTELDGRFWTTEVCTSFTGRVVGMYAIDGTMRFSDFRYRGWETGESP